MTSTRLRSEAAVPRVSGAGSLPTRTMAAFSGPVGFVLKIVFLAIVNALAVWIAAILVSDRNWKMVALVAASTAAIDAIYLVPRRTVPAKFLVPGTVFLLAFQVAPIIYTLNVAFARYSTGHILTKDEAISTVRSNSLEESGRTYTMAPARDEDGQLVLLLIDDESGKTFVGTREGLEPLDRGDVRVAGGLITSAKGYTVLTGQKLIGVDKELSGFTVPTGGIEAIRPEGLETALELSPTLRYDKRSDTFVRISDGKVFRDNGRGSFVAASGEELEPGWRTGIGFANFRRIARDPIVRQPFIRVFIWTFVFAALTVGLSFAVGLFLAIALDKPGMRLQRLYRSMIIVPFAMPAFLSLLVWSGLLNDDFGIVNRILHIHVPWLFDANWARVAAIIVSVWLTAPYFFLVSLGALQSIPSELVEAARVDGAGPRQVFRRVTFPLLLVAVAPLLIASFAFNFNDFNKIYLLTGGGPPAEDQSIAGATDILISYTFKIAFESGKGQDYGLASAISIIIFFIVASMSAVTFWRSRTLEEMR